MRLDVCDYRDCKEEAFFLVHLAGSRDVHACQEHAKEFRKMIGAFGVNPDCDTHMEELAKPTQAPHYYE